MLRHYFQGSPGNTGNAGERGPPGRIGPPGKPGNEGRVGMPGEIVIIWKNKILITAKRKLERL